VIVQRAPCGRVVQREAGAASLDLAGPTPSVCPQWATLNQVGAGNLAGSVTGFRVHAHWLMPFRAVFVGSTARAVRGAVKRRGMVRA
jgi:hypothetical protein